MSDVIIYIIGYRGRANIICVCTTEASPSIKQATASLRLSIIFAFRDFAQAIAYARHTVDTTTRVQTLTASFSAPQSDEIRNY